ncbi:hypothetical protein [Streptomyces pseudovenezuelae]
MAQIQAFIRDNLGEPYLTPDAIAAAHHISPRYLHKLFQQHGHTVAGRLRERRPLGVHQPRPLQPGLPRRVRMRPS